MARFTKSITTTRARDFYSKTSDRAETLSKKWRDETTRDERNACEQVIFRHLNISWHQD